MRVWLYGRLSNDDDVMMNSLENQLAIVREYARKQGYQIVGESYDDNVSGMRFDRKGLNQVTQAVDAGKIDAVIVKERWNGDRWTPSSSKTYPGWGGIKCRQHCSSTTCDNAVWRLFL